MSAPRQGEPAKTRQEDASLVVYDHAGYITDGGGPRPTRFVYVWFWNGVNVFSIPAPGLRTNPDVVLPGEDLQRIPLGPTNIGGSFHVVEYGGVLTPANPGSPVPWVEWSIENAGGGPIRPSNTVVVQPWETLPPPGGGPVTAEEINSSRLEAQGDLYRIVERWRANGISDLTIFNTQHYQLIRALSPELPGKTRNAIRDAIRGVLDQPEAEE